MTTATVKSDLVSIAKHLSPRSTYADAMYELYVHMKIAKGKQDVRQGRTISHEQVKRRYGL